MLKYEGIATVKNLNLRRENQNERARLGSDLKIQIRTRNALLTTLVGDRGIANELRAAFWDQNGGLRCFAVNSLQLSTIFRRQNVTLDGYELKCTTIDSLVVMPEDRGTLAIEMRVKLNPESEDIPHMTAALLVGGVMAKIEPEVEDLLGEAHA